MKYTFVEKELKKFVERLNEIIICLDNGCDEIKGSADILVIINKLHFYSQEFFVNNEMYFRSDSEALLFVKTQRANFIQGVKKFQVRFLDGDKSAMADLRDYLQEWINTL